MKKYMAILITIYGNSCDNNARLYYTDDELGLEIATTISYEEGMTQLRQLEKRLGKPAQMKINQFDRNIAYKELYGFIDRE